MNPETPRADYAARVPRSRKARTIFAPPPPPAAPAGPPTFGVYAREWLTLQRGSHAHLADCRSLIETHLIPTFGAYTMAQFTIEDAERLLVALKKRGLGGVRINKARALLSRLLTRAVKNRWLESNVVLETRREREAKAVVDPLAFEDVKRLLDKGLAHEPEMRRLSTVAIFTGLRTSELLALQWGDVDLSSATPTANIRRAVTKLDGVHETKTEGSERTIDLRPQVVAALKAQRASSQLKSDYIFPNALGGPLDRDNLATRVWYPALKRAGLKARKPYQTRHTFATLALSAGEEIGWVARQLGHTSTAMVIKHYYRFVKNNTRQDGSALDKAAASFGL
jgi:integrase